jgi:hypothetical protein
MISSCSKRRRASSPRAFVDLAGQPPPAQRVRDLEVEHVGSVQDRVGGIETLQNSGGLREKKQHLDQRRSINDDGR